LRAALQASIDELTPESRQNVRTPVGADGRRGRLACEPVTRMHADSPLHGSMHVSIMHTLYLQNAIDTYASLREVNALLARTRAALRADERLKANGQLSAARSCRMDDAHHIIDDESLMCADIHAGGRESPPSVGGDILRRDHRGHSRARTLIRLSLLSMRLSFSGSTSAAQSVKIMHAGIQLTGVRSVGDNPDAQRQYETALALNRVDVGIDEVLRRVVENGTTKGDIAEIEKLQGEARDLLDAQPPSLKEQVRVRRTSTAERHALLSARSSSLLLERLRA
jgi:hypothetical protein